MSRWSCQQVGKSTDSRPSLDNPHAPQLFMSTVWAELTQGQVDHGYQESWGVHIAWRSSLRAGPQQRQHSVFTGKDRARIGQVWVLDLKIMVLIAPGSQWPGGGLAGARFGQEAKGRAPLMQVERNQASLYQSGLWDTGQAFHSLRMGFPPCLSPQEAAGRVLRDRREEMLLWPSLIIRPFNCNYFCN